VLHAFDGKTPFSPASLERIQELKRFYDFDLDSSASHRLKEIKARPARKRSCRQIAGGLPMTEQRLETAVTAYAMDIRPGDSGGSGFVCDAQCPPRFRKHSHARHRPADSGMGRDRRCGISY
jgi:hypothetical protein